MSFRGSRLSQIQLPVSSVWLLTVMPCPRRPIGSDAVVMMLWKAPLAGFTSITLTVVDVVAVDVGGLCRT